MLPGIETTPHEDPDTRARLRAGLTEARWLALTSRRAAAAVRTLLAGAPATGVAIAAVGRAVTIHSFRRFFAGG